MERWSSNDCWRTLDFKHRDSLAEQKTSAPCQVQTLHGFFPTSTCNASTQKAASGVVGSTHYSLAGHKNAGLRQLLPCGAGCVALSLLFASGHWVAISETARRVLWPDGAAVSNTTL